MDYLTLILRDMREILIEVREFARRMRRERDQVLEVLGEPIPEDDPSETMTLESTARCLRIIDEHLANVATSVDLTDLSEEELAVLERVLTRQRTKSGAPTS